jgi:hypothetical protein
MTSSRYPWRIFWVLFIAAVAGAIGILPYAFEVLGRASARAGAEPEVTPLFIAAQILHLTLVFGVATAAGLFLARRVGMPHPFLEQWLGGSNDAPAPGTWRVALIAGLATGIVTVAIVYGILLPQAPEWPSEAAVPLWKRLLVCVYGGINEEVLMRLFLLSLVLWLLQKITRRSARESTHLFWISNVVVALLFGAAYLPAAAKFVTLTPAVAGTILAVKGVSGLVFGHLCWRRGLEAAMLAHFVSDILLHIVGPLLQR